MGCQGKDSCYLGPEEHCINIFTGLQYSSRDENMMSLPPSRPPHDPGTPDHIHSSSSIPSFVLPLQGQTKHTSKVSHL